MPLVEPQQVATLFATFGRRWPHLWAPVAQDVASRSVWLRDLQALGVRAADFERGLQRTGALEFPPSPGAFAKACLLTADDLGLPTELAAYDEALAISCGRKRPDRCSHPAVWHALGQVGPLGAMDEKSGRSEWSRVWRKTVEQAVAGEEFLPIPKALPPPESVRLSPDERRRLAEKNLPRIAELFRRGDK